VTPTTYDGNITAAGNGNNYGCDDFVTVAFTGVDAGPPLGAGVHVYSGSTPGGSSFTLTVTVSPGSSVDFAIVGGNVLVAAIKGSDSVNLYDYQPGGSTADTDLRAPNFPGTISHAVFCIGDPTTPAAVATSSFSAVRHGKAVTVRWRTASEVDTLGFNVYRQSKGNRVKLNHSLIQAKSLNGNASTGRYVFRSRIASAKLAASSFYWLQEVHTNGTRTWYGPARAIRAS
jgi:hypothetical protein